eukprot:3715002-Prymnesium_polylepis.2
MWHVHVHLACGIVQVVWHVARGTWHVCHEAARVCACRPHRLALRGGAPCAALLPSDSGPGRLCVGAGRERRRGACDHCWT